MLPWYRVREGNILAKLPAQNPWDWSDPYWDERRLTLLSGVLHGESVASICQRLQISRSEARDIQCEKKFIAGLESSAEATLRLARARMAVGVYEALGELLRGVRDPKATASSRRRAATALLDRHPAFAKMQRGRVAHDVTHRRPPVNEMEYAEVVEELKELASKA